MLWSLVLIVSVGFTGSELSNTCCNADKEIKVDWITSQSSNYTGGGIVHSSERAVDGLNDNCSHTTETSGNWWTIDLRGVYNISCVSIFNNNCDAKSNLSGAQIYIGYSREENGTANPLYQNIINFTLKEQNYFCQANVSGRYVTVFFPKKAYLILCEVKIFGKIKESPFTLIRENKTWADALYHCRDHHETLASIVDKETQTWAELEAENSSTPFVWVGLRYTCTLDFWFWVEDQSVKFTRWGPESKKEECNRSGAIEKQGNHLWSSEWADNNYNFICKRFL